VLKLNEIVISSQICPFECQFGDDQVAVVQHEGDLVVVDGTPSIEEGQV